MSKLNWKTKKIAGLTMIELLISLLISSIAAIAFISMFATQVSIVSTQSRRAQIEEEGREVFDILLRLLYTANTSSLSITQTATKTSIDFTIPSGFNVWPNIIPPYTNNAIRILWADNGANANQIVIASAPTIGGLNGAAINTLAGSSNTVNTQVTGLTLTGQGDGSYMLTLNVTTGNGAGTVTSRIFSKRFIPRNQ